MRVGYFLSCEEYRPDELLDQARLAEQTGFQALWISDHYHPWTDAQGQSPFVWSMIGALSQVCRLPVTTAVTCPTVRIHPAVLAQAAATSAVLHSGRFALGVGSGEALNEHPNSALPGELSQVLPSPRHFEQTSQLVRPEMMKESFVCGPDPGAHLAMLDRYEKAGFDEVYVANTGPYHRELCELYANDVLPRLR